MTHPVSPPSERTHLRLLPALPAAGQVDVALLVAGARGGDRKAMHALYMGHVDVITGMLVRLTRSRDTGRELAQEAFLLAFEQLGELQDDALFKPWLTQMAARLAHRHMKRARWRFKKFTPDATVTLELAAREDLSAESRSELAAIDAALCSVDADQRMAWMLRRIEDEPLDVIAAACDCSVATAKRWIDIADTHVRRALGGAP